MSSHGVERRRKNRAAFSAHQLAGGRLADDLAPRDDVIGRVGEHALGVGEIGFVHEHVVAEDVDDRLRHRRALERLDRAEDPTHLDELERRVLELGRNRAVRDETNLLVEAQDEVGQPTVAGLDGADAQVGKAIEQAADQYVAEQSLRAPRMRGGAGERGVAPHVAIAGEVRRLVEERVMHDRQVGFVHRGEDRVEIGVVDRQALGQHEPHAGDPVLLGQPRDLARRPLGIAGVGEHQALEPARVGTGVVVEIPVIRLVHQLGQLELERRAARRPCARDDEVDVDAFDIHVEQAPRGVVVLDVVVHELARRRCCVRPSSAPRAPAPALCPPSVSTAPSLRPAMRSNG